MFRVAFAERHGTTIYCVQHHSHLSMTPKNHLEQNDWAICQIAIKHFYFFAFPGEEGDNKINCMLYCTITLSSILFEPTSHTLSLAIRLHFIHKVPWETLIHILQHSQSIHNVTLVSWRSTLERRTFFTYRLLPSYVHILAFNNISPNVLVPQVPACHFNTI